MEDCKPMTIPLVFDRRKIDASGSVGFDSTLYRQLIGSLMYLVNNQLDINFAVKSLSQFMGDPQRVHWMMRSTYFATSEVQWSMDWFKRAGVVCS